MVVESVVGTVGIVVVGTVVVELVENIWIF